MSDFNLHAKGLFGRYCRIEMFRYGVPNEFYIHKIVSQTRQNYYCDVPLRWDSEPETHPAKEGVQFPDNLEEVIWVVQCGIDETRVFPVALKDVELLGEGFNEGCEFQKVGSDGYPFCASATEIMRLRDENTRLRDENAKLREELANAPKCETCEAMLDCDECLRADESHKERRRLERENAKLRKLLRKVEHYERMGCNECPHCDSCDADTLYDEDCAMSREIEHEKYELGIEVDG